MPLESGTQILSYHGDPNLAVGTAGGLGENAPIGNLNIGSPNSNGFDTLAKLTFLKNKAEYDKKQKDISDAYEQLRQLDLSTGNLLEVDKNKLVNEVVPKLTDFLSKHPQALNPQTPQDIKDNIEFKKLEDEFKTKKAQAQTRILQKGKIDEEIAQALPSERKALQDWYNKPLDTPFARITPSQKVYAINFDKFGKQEEEFKSSPINPNDPVQHEKALKTNFGTSMNDVAIEYKTNPDFQKAVDDQVGSMVKLEATRLAKQQADIAAAQLIVDPTAKEAAIKAATTTPFLAPEINRYNNYATQYNALQKELKSTKPLYPIYDPTKIPTAEQYAQILVANKVVDQKLLENVDKLNPLTELYSKLKVAEDRINSRGGASANTQDYLLQAVSPFIKPTAEELYNAGLSGGYTKTLKEQGVYYNPENKENVPTVETKVVITPDGRNLAKYNGVLVEYKDGEWKKADDNLSIDERISQKLKGNIDSVVRKGKELEINYTVVENKVAVPKTIRMSRATYLRDLATGNKDFTATQNELESYGIYDLDNDEQFAKAVELATTGKISGMTPTKTGNTQNNSTTTKKYSLGTKTFTTDQVHKAAQASGMSDDEYIKQAGLK